MTTFKVKVSEVNDENLKSLEKRSLKILMDCIIADLPKSKIRLSESFLDKHYDRIHKIETIVHRLYDNMFDKYYNRNEKILKNWNYIDTSWLPKGSIKEKIRELLIEGKKVKTGYCCTKIRELHE